VLLRKRPAGNPDADVFKTVWIDFSHIVLG